MIEDVLKDAERRMKKSAESLQEELTRVRTGRAHPSLLDHVTVNYYGTETPLNQVATIHAQDARTLAIQPWEKKLVPDIEKAILNSDLGLNPVTSGDVIRIPLPPLTEERRRELIKVVRGEAENTKVAIRNIRRDANHHLKELLKEKDITEDEDRRAEERVQKLTDKWVSEVDKLLAAKEEELLTV